MFLPDPGGGLRHWRVKDKEAWLRGALLRHDALQLRHDAVQLPHALL